MNSTAALIAAQAKQLACHEAGHAVVFALLGGKGKVVRLTLPVPGDRFALTYLSGPELCLRDQVCGLVSGHVAERLGVFTSNVFQLREGAPGDLLDGVRVGLLLSKISDLGERGQVVDEERQRSKRLLLDHWSYVIALSTALRMKGHLSGGELQDLLPPPLPRTPLAVGGSE